MCNIIISRKSVRYLSILVLLISACVLSSQAQITIIVNKGKFSTVEEAAAGEEKVNWWDADLSDDRACTECFAATELAAFLKLCPSLNAVDIRYASPKKLPAEGDVFILGSRKSNPLIRSKLLPASPDLKTDQSLRIHAFPDKGRIVTIIEGQDRVGTLYGVYAYLEQLGFRFYGLDEQGTVYPEGLVHLPREIDIVQNPSFLSRGFIGLGNRGDENIFFWMARNRMNYCDEVGKGNAFRKKLGMILARGGHGIQAGNIPPNGEYPYNHPKFTGDEHKPKDPYVSTDEYIGDVNNDGKLTYFEAHHEWYGFRNGKRNDKILNYGETNYCTSNADATKELAKNLVRSMVDGSMKNADIVNFWMIDGGKWCECENCQKQGNYSARFMDVIYAVQKEIKKAQQEKRLNREILLASLAYHETLPPPDRPLPEGFDYSNFAVTFFPIERCYVHTIADPSCTEINQFLLENYQGWTTGEDRNYKGPMLIGEYFNVSSFKSLPIVLTKILANDIPWYYSTGTRHFNYMHTPTHVWGTWTLNQYMLARLLWNVETDSKNLLDEYFRRYYPTTTESTRSFYEHLETALANLKAFKHYAGKNFYKMRNTLIRDDMEIFPLDHLHYEPYHPELNDGPDIIEMIDEMRIARKEIDASMLKCTDKTEQARLIDDERRFAYGEAMVYFYYHLVRTAMLHRRSEILTAKHEFQKVEHYAALLREVRDLVNPLPGVRHSDITAADGLEASQGVNVYEYYKKIYGE